MKSPEYENNGYLENFAASIEQSPDCAVLKPEFFEDRLWNYSEPYAEISQGNGKAFDIYKENPDLGILPGREHMTQVPIDVSEVLERRGLDPDTIIHRGFIIARGVNNTEQIQNSGVFGNISTDERTYMMAREARIIPNSTFGRKDIAQPIMLEVDVKKLMEYRSAITDIEFLYSRFESDVPGHGFFVFGGIPAKAIRAVTDGNKQRIEINHERRKSIIGDIKKFFRMNRR